MSAIRAIRSATNTEQETLGKMTHDELLARIDYMKFEVGDSGINEESTAIQALRAVVELHKPRAYKNETDEMYIKGWNAAMDRVIQAIEKELK